MDGVQEKLTTREEKQHSLTDGGFAFVEFIEDGHNGFEFGHQKQCVCVHVCVGVWVGVKANQVRGHSCTDSMQLVITLDSVNS